MQEEEYLKRKKYNNLFYKIEWVTQSKIKDRERNMFGETATWKLVKATTGVTACEDEQFHFNYIYTSILYVLP